MVLVSNSRNSRRETQIQYYNGQKYSSIQRLHKIGGMHGAKRVMVFCLMTAILPTLLIITPLYLRHVVFADVTYPVAESDVLVIQEGISPLFCSAVSLKMNSSFNGFQLLGTPQLSSKRRHIRLKKSMILPDDTLEYWGFYLLRGAMVKLKVCSLYEGSRILVVRGHKNLKTCGLLDHNLKKYGAKMDVDHHRVKVTYENPAELLGIVDHDRVEDNGGEVENEDDEDEVDLFIRKRLEKGKARKFNATVESNAPSDGDSEKAEQITEESTTPKATRQHRKRHIRKHHDDVTRLKNRLFPDDDEAKRPMARKSRDRRNIGISELDAHIKHGGNAYNASVLENESASVSSFETDLLTCYDGQILLTEGFAPSDNCRDVSFLEKGNHMITTHEVASDGYYYYIFYSDNDNYKNDIHAIFDIYKPTYRYSNSSNVRECVNATECRFDMSIAADEVVIVEVPTRDGIDHESDDITLLTSTCHPRTTVYMIFPILVLILILGCAFL